MNGFVHKYSGKILSIFKGYGPSALNTSIELQEEPDEKPWYLSDEPLPRLGTEDKLRHKAYVQVILKVIKETSPPFTLGLFGGWGVGKTSIVNEFRESMKEDQSVSKCPVAYIDIWKYEQDSLRRQFLIDIQNQLKKAKNPLSKKHDVESILYKDLTTQTKREHF